MLDGYPQEGFYFAYVSVLANAPVYPMSGSIFNYAISPKLFFKSLDDLFSVYAAKYGLHIYVHTNYLLSLMCRHLPR